jgi:hypothetical protein
MITTEIVCGAKGCGKSEQIRQAMHLSPEEYQRHIENCEAAITGDYCPICSWRTWLVNLPSPNGICLWELCCYCGTARRVAE